MYQLYITLWAPSSGRGSSCPISF